MSTITGIPNSAIIPVVESRLFEDHPQARFAVGRLAVRDEAVLGLENEYTGYYDLRTNTYVEQTDQLDASEVHVHEDGHRDDRDLDDGRSVAFGIIENRHVDQRVVAAMRLIVKGSVNTEHTPPDGFPLPIEEFFPQVFANGAAGANSLEVSRLIARHEKAAIQELLKWKIYSVALAHVALNNLGPVYGIIEPGLEKHLNASVPISRIGEPKLVEHYRDVNLPIQVHTDRFLDKVRQMDPGGMEELMHAAGAMTYFGRIPGSSSRDGAAA